MSGGYEITIKAVDVIFSYAFDYKVSNPTAVKTANVIVVIMTRYAYLLTLIIADKGSSFVSNVMHNIVEVLGTTFRHATT